MSIVLCPDYDVIGNDPDYSGRVEILGTCIADTAADLPDPDYFSGFTLANGFRGITSEDGAEYILDSSGDWHKVDKSPYADVYTKTEVNNITDAIAADVSNLQLSVSALQTSNDNQSLYIYNMICYSDFNYLDYKLSNNLFDKDNTQIYAATLSTAGQWSNATSATTMRIPCKPNTTYCISISTSGTIFRIAETASNMIPNSAYDVPVTRKLNGTTETSYSFTTSSSAKYIIFQGGSNDLSNWFDTFMLNYGNTALTYVPYNKTSVRNGSTTAGNGYICQDLPVNMPAGNYVWKMKRDGNTTTTMVVKAADDTELYRVTRGAGVNDITQLFTIAADAAKVSIYVGYNITYTDNMIFKNLTA